MINGEYPIPLRWVLHDLLSNWMVKPIEGMQLVADLYDPFVKKLGEDVSVNAIASGIAKSAGLKYTGNLNKVTAEKKR